MRSWQPPGTFAVTGGNRQFLESLTHNAANDIMYYGFGSREPSEAMLCSDFPGGGSAYEDIVLGVGNDVAGGTRQPLTSSKPPEKSMRVE